MVASSEEIEPHKEMESLNVYFQKVKVENNKVEIMYQNKGQEILYIYEGDILAHMEKMGELSPHQILHRAENEILGLYLTILDLNYRNDKGSISSLYLDLIEEEEKIDWNRLECANDDQIKENLIRLCRKYSDIWAVNKQSVGCFDLGSDGPFHISVKTSVPPMIQPNIPPSEAYCTDGP